MAEKSLIKNIEFSTPLELLNLVQYQEGQVVSRTFAQSKVISLTLFAFDEGEGLTTHTAAGDAFVQILDGEASITIGGEEFSVGAGQVIVMPAKVPHALDAKKRFKMLLVVVKPTE